MCGVCIYWCGRRAGGGAERGDVEEHSPSFGWHSAPFHFNTQRSMLRRSRSPRAHMHTPTHTITSRGPPAAQSATLLCVWLRQPPRSLWRMVPPSCCATRLAAPRAGPSIPEQARRHHHPHAMRQVIPKRVRAWRASTTYISCDRCQQPQRDQVSILQASFGQAAHRVNGASPRGERSCRAR